MFFTPAGESFQFNKKIIFPDPLIQGDTWCFSFYGEKWAEQLFTASITFAALTSKLTAPATLNDAFYQWNIPPSATSQLAPQPYAYNVNITDLSTPANRWTAERGAVVVSEDIGVPGTSIANKSNLQLMLEACDATLISLLSNKTSMVQFAGQMYQMQDVEKLFGVRNQIYLRFMDELEKLEGNKRGRRIITVFRTM